MPLLIAHRVVEDDPRYLKIAMALLLVAAVLAMAFWTAGHIAT